MTAHQFEGSWQPHPEKRGIEHERYEERCTACGLTIVDPTDAYPVDHCPAVKALSPEWLELMGHPKECTPKPKKRPYTPPKLQVLGPHEVIRKLLDAFDRRGGVSEQANGVPRSHEHEREHGARKAEAPEFGDLAVTGEPIGERTGNGDEHGNESDHG